MNWCSWGVIRMNYSGKNLESKSCWTQVISTNTFGDKNHFLKSIDFILDFDGLTHKLVYMSHHGLIKSEFVQNFVPEALALFQSAP